MSNYEVIYIQPNTPPYERPSTLPGSAHSRNSSNSSCYSTRSSPASIRSTNTRQTTPAKSPVWSGGPVLLPKVREQDQFLEPIISPIRHRRVQSNTRNPSGFTPYPMRPTVTRSVTSPPDCISLISPTSTSSAFNSALNSPITLTSSHSRQSSSGHSRSTSSSSIDSSVLGKYGFPYRQLPSYITSSTLDSSSYPTIRVPSYHPPTTHLQDLYHVNPVTYDTYSPVGPSPYGPQFTYMQASPEYTLPAELQYSNDGDLRFTTLLDYLTSSNPAPHTVRKSSISTGRETHFWWDIRNLRSWSDFNLETINEIPGLMALLQAEVPDTEQALPKPSSGIHHQPASESGLHQLYSDFYLPKVTAALAASQGRTHISMRDGQSTSRKQPDFVSSYKDDVSKTFFGDKRGRVVGLVKSFDRWNTGMRNELPNLKVQYLQGLAHLHHHMREHGCRYGFIMTEIELVCVRAGTDDVPYFGYLELAPTIQMRTQGRGQITACLALWYLHMLAKEEPLPGQHSWNLDVGGPASLTRQNVLERDEWIARFQPQTKEKRTAKANRGWFMPTEDISRKHELPRNMRRQAKGWSR
ncbi:MAG: hypothetical protein M1827_002722 [Pycnora praestabilis]|nr:MAG: hypothetical protein M1827_002722 [Pycnora praestabilis]